jgi:hypothetical protein
MPCAQVRREMIFPKKLGEPPPKQTKKKKKSTMTASFFVFPYHTTLLFPYFFDATDSAPPTNKLLRSEI